MYASQMKRDAPIVLVYLNSPITKYIQKNLKLLSKRFPNRKIVLLSNKENNRKRVPKSSNVSFYFLTNFEQQHSILTDLSNLPRNFRNGFWISAIARFKALEIFMLQQGEKSVFHIEADVLLLPNFPFDCKIFEEPKLAFPYVSEKMAAASVFYVGEVSILTDFNNFIRKSIADEPGITDMKILANYGSLKKDNVVRLYSGFGDSAYTCSNYIFDAATFGMYLTGQDPRNSKGFVKTYFDVDDHVVKPSEIIFNFNEKNEVVSRIGNKNYLLANLHVHSKQSKYFSKNRSEKLIRKAVVGDYKEQKRSFSYEIWSMMVINYLVRRIQKKFPKSASILE
jgi:hypothetical protein